MTVGVVGLGLIGGSIAKAYKKNGAARVLAVDTDRTVMGYALLSGMADGELTDENAGECGLLLIATYPRAAAEYLEHVAPLLSRGCLVIDCLGVKERICALGFGLAERYGFTFAGGHPMAGSQNSGVKYSDAGLFEGSSMVIVPPRTDDMELLERIKTALEPLGFGSISVSSAQHHDAIIAYTSHLTHIVANALVKSPTARLHQGYSAGSFRDLTRVAALNEDLWSELFLENSEKLVPELDMLISQLEKYRSAIKNGDAEALEGLLREGSRIKKEIDAR